MLTKQIKNFIIGATMLCSAWSFMSANHSQPRQINARADIVSVTELDDIDFDLEARKYVPERLQWKIEETNILVEYGQLEDYHDIEVAEGENILGFYRHDGSAIVLESDDTDIMSTLKHELGHAVDIYMEDGVTKYMYSGSDYFQEIFREEGEVLFEPGAYGLSDIHEYFAECYSMYLDDNYKAELEEYAPRTYSYIQNVVWRS